MSGRAPLPIAGPDALVVGSGPNGLAAAITLAQAGRSVLVLERADTLGGGTRSAELTLPGFLHDVCSAVHPLGGRVAVLSHAAARASTASSGAPAAPAGAPARRWARRSCSTARSTTPPRDRRRRGAPTGALMEPLVARRRQALPDLLGPLRLPRHPLPLARFGARAPSAPPPAWRAGASASERAPRALRRLRRPLHPPASSSRPRRRSGSCSCAAAHVGGLADRRAAARSAIADALAAHLRSLGGEIGTGSPVESLDDLPTARALLLDLTPRQVLRSPATGCPDGYRRALGRYRYGPGVFKLDWALDGPIPWTAPECRRAGTVHLGGTLEEIAASERAVWQGSMPERPFVLWHSRASTTRRARPRASTWRGPTATCRRARPWT